MNYQTFLINLDKSTDRLAASTEMLNALGLEFERVPAIYGADLLAEDVAQAYTTRTSNRYHKELNLGEIGCYLSHRKTWKLIIKRKLDFALIFEDDFLPKVESINEIITLVNQIQTPWHLIKLMGKHKRADEICGHPMKELTFSLLKKVPTRTGMQIVSNEGAKRLLASSKPFSRPVDVDLQYWWEKNIWVHGIQPYPFKSNSEGSSEIEKFSNRKAAKKSRLKKLGNKISFTLNTQRQAKKLIQREPQLLTPPLG